MEYNTSVLQTNHDVNVFYCHTVTYKIRLAVLISDIRHLSKVCVYSFY